MDPDLVCSEVIFVIKLIMYLTNLINVIIVMGQNLSSAAARKFII